MQRRVVVGLGNPGHNYRETRHNVGFRVIQLLAQNHSIAAQNQQERTSSMSGCYEDAGVEVTLIMPLTMMNASGQALRELESEWRHVLIVCDDVNLPLGTLRFRAGGGSGGHHGLESCIGVIGTEEVPRLRIGVGSGKLPKDLSSFVLSRFGSDEQPAVEETLERAAEACEVWIHEGIEVAMNRFN